MWAIWVLVMTVLAIIFYRAASRPSLFPPGPLSLPIIGSMLSIMPSPQVSFPKFQKRFGDVCSFKAFRKWTILISDPTLMRTAFSDSRISARPELYLFTSRNVIISGKEEPLGIIGTSGDVWKHQRRFTLRSLKDQGFGRHSIEPIIQSELAELGDYFASKENEKISVGNTFTRSIINVIWAMIMGKRFSYDDEQLQQLVDKVNRMLQSFDPINPALNFRFIKKLFPNLEIFKRVDGYMKDLLLFTEEQMESYVKEMEDNDDPGSYLGLYLKEMKESAEGNKQTPLNMHHLKANMMELFIAGSETTSSTMWWAVYLMATNPEVQETIQQELDQVIGQDNIPTLDLIDSLPYTTAAIYEVQRVADLLPFAAPHNTMEDVTVGGYKIPKNTDVMFNLSYAHKSPKYWKHPDKFYPEHFLTPDGKPYKPDHFMPFGYGKRVCLGESLARLKLFLFFTNIVHRFSWRMSDDPVTWEKSVIVTRPPNFTVFVSQRNTNTTHHTQSSHP